ncbi:MAG: hypothetical protein N2C13_00630 [Chloroflexota bacterium]
MANAEKSFEALVENLIVDPDVKQGRMFGFDSITVMGKTFALLDGDSMVFKLIGESHASALALDGAFPWNPFGHQKKEWLQIPLVYCAEWETYAEAARKYVHSLIKVAL